MLPLLSSRLYFFNDDQGSFSGNVFFAEVFCDILPHFLLWWRQFFLLFSAVLLQNCTNSQVIKLLNSSSNRKCDMKIYIKKELHLLELENFKFFENILKNMFLRIMNQRNSICILHGGSTKFTHHFYYIYWVAIEIFNSV